MKETPRRTIMVKSSLKEISTDQLEKKGGRDAILFLQTL
jgi:hypothetical protein